MLKTTNFTYIVILQNYDNDLIPISQLIDVKKGNSHKFAQGSWIHPDLTTNLAQWISPKFGVQVSRWVREIITTGKAEYDSKPNDELIRLQLELQKEQDARKKLEMKHKRILQRREYHKFQKGDDKFKIGLMVSTLTNDFAPIVHPFHS